MKKLILFFTIMLFTTSLVFGDWHIDEGFEGGIIPGDWTIIDVDGNGTWFPYEYASAHSGDWVAAVAGSGSGDNDWLITPQVTIESGDSFSFYARSWFSTEDMDVMLSTNGGNSISDFDVTLESVTGLGDSWVEYAYDLSSYVGQVCLAIHWTYDNYALLVDDVKVGQDAPLAPDPPVATAATTDGTLTFFANWNASTGATGYYLDVATDAGFTTFLPGYNDLDVGNVITYSVTALSAVDHYYRLRAYNAGGTSADSNIISVLDSALPVELSSFTAQFVNDNLSILWTTQSESGNMGWNIYRGESVYALENDETTQINAALIEGAGNSTEPTDYSFQDQYPVVENNTYWYWLESVSYSNNAEIYGPISLTIPEGAIIPELPEITLLKGNYPNPFNPITKIALSIKEGETGTLTIYNTKGQEVECVTYEEGKHIYEWDAADYCSGLYFFKLSTSSYNETKKMILLK